MWFDLISHFWVSFFAFDGVCSRSEAFATVCECSRSVRARPRSLFEHASNTPQRRGEMYFSRPSASVRVRDPFSYRIVSFWRGFLQKGTKTTKGTKRGFE